MPDGPQRSDDKKLLVQIAKYSELAFVLPAATVAGWLIGAGFDRWLHLKWCYLAGLVLGIVAGFIQLIRTVAAGDK